MKKNKANRILSRRCLRGFSLLFMLALSACRSEELVPPDGSGGAINTDFACDDELLPGDLVINELVAKNGGVWIDESGATEDYLELFNAGTREIALQNVAIEDNAGTYPLPSLTLKAGEHLLLWADDDPEEGLIHLPFKLSSKGETLRLLSCGEALDELTYPKLEENDSYARYPDGHGTPSRCRYASPDRSNGEKCAPPIAKGLATTLEFADFEWPQGHPQLPTPLVLSELALHPASFIEIENTGDETLDLNDYILTIAPIYPGWVLPDASTGEIIDLGDTELAPGERLSISVSEDQVAEIAADPVFEGIVSVFDKEGSPIDRIDFMHWPEGASLSRPDDSPERAVFCLESTPDAANNCKMLESREIDNRVRHLRTHGDFSALAVGGTHLSTESVKVIVDVEQGGLAHLLSALKWPLHYTFVREVVEGKAPLDRCDQAENAEFNQGWYDFSVTEYFNTVGRSFFLSTFVKHGATGHQSVEFTPGDEILGTDMVESFFKMTEHTLSPTEWYLRPQSDEQVEKLRPFEGTLPLLPTNAPFSDLRYQPLTQGEGFGVLTFVPADELHTSPLGSQIILVTDDVPNDIPLTGGLITQAFQTPLAHVNILSQNRGTPNMALRDVLDDERISSNLGKLVRLVVEGDDFQIEEANAEDAQAFWDSFRSSGDLQIPRLDTTQRELVDLLDANLDSIPMIGAKASQMAEMYKVEKVAPSPCTSKSQFEVPHSAFAVPVVHFLEHFEWSGAQDLFHQLKVNDSFQADPLARAKALADVRELIWKHPVDENLLADLKKEIEDRFGNDRIRLRSSSNAEDLPGFNGAGLYQSRSAELGDDERLVEDALREVWASLFSARAYDEREMALVDHEAVSMGVLVHEAFPKETANGVGVSRNVLDPIRGDMYYLNIQAGEASVTNPAPGVATEELTYQWPTRTPRLAYQSYSSLRGGDTILSPDEVDDVACALYNIHAHFRPLLDPEEAEDWFAMEIEFKLREDSRSLVVKQARPHAFSGYEVAGDCREL